MGHQDNAGKFIAFILRHHPEAIGMKLDEHGWARTEDLIAGIAKSRPFDMQMLEEIVRTDSKQRYSFNEDKTLIRANQSGQAGKEQRGPHYRHHRPEHRR